MTDRQQKYIDLICAQAQADLARRKYNATGNNYLVFAVTDGHAGLAQERYDQAVEKERTARKQEAE